MNRAVSIILSLALLTLPSISAQKALSGEIGHRLVTFKPQSLAYKNFTLPTSVEGAPIELHAAAKGKKLILITYFAAWCENSNHDAQTINELYRKYENEGLAVIGVCNYSTTKEIGEFINKQQPPYPIGIESVDDKLREKTTHYSYRKLCGDERKWGTPFSLLIEAKNIQPDGEIFANNVLAANGELDKKEAENLIKQLLK